MMSTGLIDILDPVQYRTAVHEFNRFFNISRKSPGITLLEEILFHFSGFPYENLSKIIKRYHSFESPEIRLPDEVLEGHIRSHLGGTCFSLTFFLGAILTHHNFEAYPVMADMRRARNAHCALIVVYEGSKYLVDPGYLLNKPMELDPAVPRIYHTDHSGVEVVYRPEDNGYHVHTFDYNNVKWRYRFQDRPVPEAEFLHYWLDSFSWNSMHGLCLTRTEKGKMIYIHKYYMRETRSGRKTNFNIRNNYHQTIFSHFMIDPAVVDEALAALSGCLAKERQLGLWVPRKIREEGA